MNKSEESDPLHPPRGWSKRGLYLALVPLGFIAIVAVLMLSGWERQNDPGVGDTTTAPAPTVESDG